MMRNDTTRTAIIIIVAAALCLGLGSCSTPLPQQSDDRATASQGTRFEVAAMVAGLSSQRPLRSDESVDSVRVTVLDNNGEQIGSGNLIKEATDWRGTIVVTATGPATFKAYGKKANGSILYFGAEPKTLSGSGDSISITVSAVGSVTYDGNGETGGTVPVDGSAYAIGDPITALAGGTLAKTGYAFAGWTTDNTGAGSSYAAATSFNKGVDNVYLFAVWIQDNLSYTSSGTAISLTGYTTKPTGALSIRAGVTSIEASTFYQCTGMTSVILPDSISSIGQNAFNQCSGLTALSLPSRLVSLGNYAFMNCTGLTSATVPKSLTTIANEVFSGDYRLTSVTLESGLAVVGTYMFENCSLLTTVAIPSSVASIRNFAFKGCTSLMNVTISDGVGTIAQGAFQNCSALGGISIPASVSTIATYAFDGCTTLLSVTMASATPPALAGGVQANAYTVFQGALGTMKIHVPTAQAVTDYKADTCWGVYGTKIETP